MANTSYSLFGSLTVVPTADLASLTSAANIKSAARKGDEGLGKRKGMVVLRDNGGGDYDIAVATGDAAADPWLIYGREATVTPS